MNTYIVVAAGGNPTAINFGGDYTRDQYGSINNRIQSTYPDVEQVGFYETKEELPKLQMAGGEFCGNATRSFACLLKSQNPKKEKFIFWVSGYPEKVWAKVEEVGNDLFYCRAQFGGFDSKITEEIIDGLLYRVVDLGGIVHIVVNEKDIPFDNQGYVETMKAIKNRLGVDRGAVGVLWVSEQEGKVFMRPVVWVKSIDTCYYETSCGSGSIAVALLEKKNISIIQPSKKEIKVEFNNDGIALSSEMEITKKI